MKDSVFETQDMEKRLLLPPDTRQRWDIGVNRYRALQRPWFPHDSFKYKSLKYNCL